MQRRKQRAGPRVEVAGQVAAGALERVDRGRDIAAAAARHHEMAPGPLTVRLTAEEVMQQQAGTFRCTSLDQQFGTVLHSCLPQDEKHLRLSEQDRAL